VRIAIALCTRDGERFLGQQLDSIAGQIRLPDEVVIGDDGSTDGTAEIVKQFAGRVSFPVHVLPAPERLGTARNFNRTIAACHADLAVGHDAAIVLADQDDVWHPDRLGETEAGFAGLSRPGLVFSDGILVDELSEPVGGTLWGLVRLSPSEIARMEAGAGPAFVTLLHRQLSLGGTVTGATMAFRAEHRSQVLPLPDWLPPWGKAAVIHDAWIALVVAAAAPVRAIPRPLVNYRVHGAQQVGLVGRPPVSRLRMARAAIRSLRARNGEGPRRKEIELHWLQALSERLRGAPATGAGAAPGDGPVAEAVRLLEGRIDHFAIRAALPASHLRRVRPIAAELGTGRYGRYSSGPLSAARDLLEP